MKLLILLGIALALFFIARNYRQQNYESIKLNIKERFEGDLYKHEAGLLIALMAKVSKADGNVSELEAQLLKHTFTDIASHFENSEEIRESLKTIYNKEKENFDNTLDICANLLKITQFDYTKRVQVMEYLLNLAFIDQQFSDEEFMITEDIANALKIKQHDFEQLIHRFKSFYANEANNRSLSIEEAYTLLGSNPDDDFTVIKKRYRELVKEYHPDIVAGRGENEDMIEQATAKLQQINEAYERIKKEKNR